MKLFVGQAGNAQGAPAEGSQASFEYIHSLGLNLQELAFVQQVYLKPEACPGVAESAKANGIVLSIHAPYFINLCTDDSVKLAASRKRIVDSLDRAGRLGAFLPVVVHAGFFQGKPAKDCVEAVAESAVELAKQYPKSILGFETTGKHSAVGSLDEVLEICGIAKQRNVVPVVDFAHLYARSMGKIDFAAVLDAVLERGHKELHCHFSGINYSEKGERNHLPLSSNQPDYAPLAQCLKERENKFDRVSLVCESPLQEQDALVMRQLLEKCGLKLA